MEELKKEISKMTKGIRKEFEKELRRGDNLRFTMSKKQMEKGIFSVTLFKIDENITINILNKYNKYGDIIEEIKKVDGISGLNKYMYKIK